MPWLIGGGAALAVVVAVVVAIGLQADDAEQPATPDPSPSSNVKPTSGPTEDPTDVPTTEPTTDPNNGLWPEVEFDPALSTETFSVDEGQAVLVSGIRIEQPYVAPVDNVGYIVSGDGFSSIGFFGPVGTVIEVPGWGLLGLMEIEEIDTGGRPEYVLHFEAQTGSPLEVTPTEP